MYVGKRRPRCSAISIISVDTEPSLRSSELEYMGDAVLLDA